MRAILQRVLRASVTVEGKIVSKIGPGLCVLVGISNDDIKKDCDYIKDKILNLRLWKGEDGKPWSRSVVQMNYDILLVSQFTLYGELKGKRLDFHKSMNADLSKKFYSDFVELVKSEYLPDRVKDGIFGAVMEVELVNDGPVTYQLDTLDKFRKKKKDSKKGKIDTKKDDEKVEN